MALNKCMLIGNLGQDPEVRITPSGQTVAMLSLATNEGYTDKNGIKKDHTEWHRIVVWGNIAEACGKYLRKGSKIYVEGPLRTRSWDDKDGNKRYTTEISALRIDFLDSKSHGEQSRPNTQSSSSAQSSQTAGRYRQQEYAPPPGGFSPETIDSDVPF